MSVWQAGHLLMAEGLAARSVRRMIEENAAMLRSAAGD